MSELLITVLAAAFGIGVFVLLLVLAYRKRGPGKAAGKTKGRTFGREKVVNVARRFAAGNSFRFIAPATLSHAGGIAILDALVVGYFGVLGLISLGYSGEIYGSPDEETWLQVGEDGARTRFENPESEAAAAVRVIRNALPGSKMKKVPVEVAVVFANPGAQLAVPRSLAPLRTKQFKANLKRERYLEDCGLNLDEVETALRAALVQEPPQ